MTLGDVQCDSRGSGPRAQANDDKRAELRRRMLKTVRSRSGPSFEDRLQKAVSERHKKMVAAEAEQRKNLAAAIERGRSTPNVSMARPQSASPNVEMMLEERRREMKRHAAQHAEKMDVLKNKIDRREPLFSTPHVNMLVERKAKRQEEIKRHFKQEEQQQRATLRSVESNALQRPLLMDDAQHQRLRPQSEVATDVPSGGARAGRAQRPCSAPWGRTVYEGDRRIQAAVSRRSFHDSEWGRELKQIREKLDDRPKLSETPCQARNHGIDIELTRTLLCTSFPAKN